MGEYHTGKDHCQREREMALGRGLSASGQRSGGFSGLLIVLGPMLFLCLWASDYSFIRGFFFFFVFVCNYSLSWRMFCLWTKSSICPRLIFTISVVCYFSRLFSQDIPALWSYQFCFDSLCNQFCFWSTLESYWNCLQGVPFPKDGETIFWQRCYHSIHLFSPCLLLPSSPFFLSPSFSFLPLHFHSTLHLPSHTHFHPHPPKLLRKLQFLPFFQHLVTRAQLDGSPHFLSPLCLIYTRK